jgi:hypothetical protein
MMVACLCGLALVQAADGEAGASRPVPAAMATLNVAVLGDIGRASDVDGIEKRLNVIHGPGVDAAVRPDAIEIATDVDLGPELNRFEAFDRAVQLAKSRNLLLFLRVKPHVTGKFEKCVVRETKLKRDGPEYKPNDQISFLDPNYQAAVKKYFRAVATRYAQEPAVLGFSVAICPSGETQYPIDGTFFGDFSSAALNDYKAWMAKLNVTVTGWPELPLHVTPDTRISRDANYYLWAYWRAQRLAQVLGDCAREIRAVAPKTLVSAFSYVEMAPPAGYGPGFLEDDPNFDWYFGSISLDHGMFGQRGQDRSRPETVAGRKLVAGEVDLISAYTDPAHMEAFARYFFLMSGQPRPFLPTWWKAGTKGGWGEAFWAPYSDDLARTMSRVVNESKRLYGSASVADVAVIVPNVSGMGVMAAWGPWASEEFRVCHTDIARHLSCVGANFDLLTEDTLTAEKLKPYRLVVVSSPALYPWVRKVLAGCSAHVLATCWAGTVTAPGPDDLTFSHAWLNNEPTWWATHGTAVQRPARIRFGSEKLAGSLGGKEMTWGKGDKRVAYVRDLAGAAIATDDEGKAVVAVADWTNGRRVYHFGLPLWLQSAGRLTSDTEFRDLLTTILRDAGCTAYGDLGPLRLYETAKWLLVENPNGTEGTAAAPKGDFDGTLPNRLHHKPAKEFLTEKGELKLKVPAGKSIVIPLE